MAPERVVFSLGGVVAWLCLAAVMSVVVLVKRYGLSRVCCEVLWCGGGCVYFVVVVRVVGVACVV
jgi:hypothetical protein